MSNPRTRTIRTRRKTSHGTPLLVGALGLSALIGVIALLAFLANYNQPAEAASTDCAEIAVDLADASETFAASAEDVLALTADADYSEVTDRLIFQAPADDVKTLDATFTSDRQALDALRAEWAASGCGSAS